MPNWKIYIFQINSKISPIKFVIFQITIILIESNKRVDIVVLSTLSNKILKKTLDSNISCLFVCKNP
jgi:hypothetical protein